MRYFAGHYFLNGLIQKHLAQVGVLAQVRVHPFDRVESTKPAFGPMRQRREELIRGKDEILDILRDGSHTARERARETMEEVRSVMGLDYGKVLSGA